ncbi:hypothetical protein C463_15862 [Halorubrum californiense DSM 19288]|uniref:Uncharacterized protein n=1 Tax=Halorubrum californiense DSM 19288 TaxID=1227465 RepID=M0DYZ0_9EURY|nr:MULTISPECIES: hypothetical protein [Halorubrum]ELZ39993.1 hypothetical protein C463_15862 [Halorubrum californiense DSM 19288]TKX73283.1 hypothetical protein EXE40_00725 [Halorubrum sp. GN11GM_10-3_MGM]
MTDGLSDGRVGFEVDGTALTVRDAIEGDELRLRVDREPELSPALPELFPAPIDRAVSFEAGSLEIPEYASIAVRDADGDHVARLDEPMDLPRGSYCIEVNGATKVLVRVTDAEISAGGAAGPGPVTLSFDRPRTVSVGGRSLHTRPEATITVPDDPTALTEAVSVLGSSIKEFTPERSWPTLRGYPPRIERGDSLEVPSPLTVPDTGVEVVVRPTYADVFRLSTLSYYLGARMTTGDAPAIRLDTGYEERLPTDGRALEERVTELFKTCFFLDTLARTEGYIPSDRYAYEELGPVLPFYPPKLTDRSMSERLMEYLEVAPETVAPYLPAWPTEAVLRPAPAAAELLPHLAHVLAPICVRGDSDSPRPGAPMAAATSPQTLAELPGSDRSGGAIADQERRSVATPGGPTTSDVPSPDTEPLQTGVSALTPAAYENRIQRQIPERGAVAVALLFGDSERARTVRASLSEPTDLDGIGSLTVLASPSPDEVAETLSDPELDIAYCGATVQNDVIDSVDGIDDVSRSEKATRNDSPVFTLFEDSVDIAVGVDAVNRGGVSALLVDGRVSADRIRSLIGLLSASFPVGVATKLALPDEGVDLRYAGDPATAVANDRGRATQLYACRPLSDDTFRVSVQSLLSTGVLIGGEFRVVHVFNDLKSTLVGTKVDLGNADISDILQIHAEKSPVVLFPNDIVLWSDDLSDEDVTEVAREGQSNAELAGCRNEQYRGE